MEKNNELLLLIILEDASNIFKLIGYGKVADKIQKNLEKIYAHGRPSTNEFRKSLGL